MHRLVAIALGALVAGWATASPAAVTSVTVWMQDPTTAPTVQAMQMAVDHSRVKTGIVRFHVMNQSKSMTHEMIVVRLKSAGDALPMLAKSDRVDERRIARLGQLPNIRPGKSGNLQRALKPGDYLLICNKPGHFRQGMKIALTVTP